MAWKNTPPKGVYTLQYYKGPVLRRCAVKGTDPVGTALIEKLKLESKLQLAALSGSIGDEHGRDVSRPMHAAIDKYLEEAGASGLP